jgi:hypothetical protein
MFYGDIERRKSGDSDDGRFLINTPIDTGKIPLPINLIQNWKPPAK